MCIIVLTDLARTSTLRGAIFIIWCTYTFTRLRSYLRAAMTVTWEDVLGTKSNAMVILNVQ